MSSNEIRNALHAGAVLALSPNVGESRVVGSWGVLRVERADDAGAWFVFLEQPVRFSGAGTTEESTVVPMISSFGGGDPGVFFTATPMHENTPEEFRGNIAIQAWTNATPPVPAAGPHYVNLVVFRVPGIGG